MITNNNNNFSHFCFLLKSNQNPFFETIALAHERREQFCVCVNGTSLIDIICTPLKARCRINNRVRLPSLSREKREKRGSTICWLASLPLASLKLFVIVGAFVCWQTLFPNFDGRCRHRGTLVQTRVGAHK